MRTLTLLFCAAGAGALTGRVALVNEFETVKWMVVSASAARFVYGFEVASAVTPVGSVSVTVPLWVPADQLWTTTGRSIELPTGIVWIAAERPRRRGAGARGSGPG